MNLFIFLKISSFCFLLEEYKNIHNCELFLISLFIKIEYHLNNLLYYLICLIFSKAFYFAKLFSQKISFLFSNFSQKQSFFFLYIIKISFLSIYFNFYFLFLKNTFFIKRSTGYFDDGRFSYGRVKFSVKIGFIFKILRSLEESNIFF